jgi:hypothetical protein
VHLLSWFDLQARVSRTHSFETRLLGLACRFGATGIGITTFENTALLMLRRLWFLKHVAGQNTWKVGKISRQLSANR